MMQDSSHPSLEQLVSSAFTRFEANLRAALPNTAPQLLEFLHGVPPLLHPEVAWNSRSFPHYVLPYWLSPARARVVDIEFQTDLLYSTVNGSHSIRLCDNIADNDGPPEVRKVAPCAAYFTNEFVRPYMKYFPIQHDFWPFLDKCWAQQAEASSVDAFLRDIDYEVFSSVSSRKFTATKIPIAAVHFRYQELEASIERWFNFVDLVGIFAQFNNDFFDWNHDAQYAIPTYISSEARRRAPGDSLATWFLREGFDWGASILRSSLDKVKEEAEFLGNREILDWVIARGHALEHDIVKARSGLDLVKTFGRIISVGNIKGGAHA
jgi:hypothetical protein